MARGNADIAKYSYNGQEDTNKLIQFKSGMFICVQHHTLD